MAKIKTADELAAALTSDFTWRLREISDYKASARGAPHQRRGVLLRGGVPLVYAHWEGHVVYAVRVYTDYVVTKRLRYSELKLSFILHALSRRFDQMYGKRLNLKEKIEFVLRVDRSRADRFSASDGEVFKTKANLNSEVLQELCSAINIDVSGFQGDFDFIDKLLVGRRNHIAHGQDLAIGLDDFDLLVERTIGLMRLFRNLIENEAYLAGYRV